MRLQQKLPDRLMRTRRMWIEAQHIPKGKKRSASELEASNLENKIVSGESFGTHFGCSVESFRKFTLAKGFTLEVSIGRIHFLEQREIHLDASI